MPPAEDTTVLPRASLRLPFSCRRALTSPLHSTQTSTFSVSHVWAHHIMSRSFTCTRQPSMRDGDEDAIQRAPSETGLGDRTPLPRVLDSGVPCVDAAEAGHAEEYVPITTSGMVPGMPGMRRAGPDVLRDHFSRVANQRASCERNTGENDAARRPLCTSEQTPEKALETAKINTCGAGDKNQGTSPTMHIDPNKLNEVVDSALLVTVATSGSSQTSPPRAQARNGEGYDKEGCQPTPATANDGAPSLSQRVDTHDITGGGTVAACNDGHSLGQSTEKTTMTADGTRRMLQSVQKENLTGTTMPTAAATVTDTAASRPEVEDDFGRPATALSVHLVTLYKRVNAQYCFQCRQALPGPKYNNGYDDKEGHYYVIPGEEILQRYSVQETLGKGSFGTVVRCFDEKRREMVALKITRLGTNFRNQAKVEADMLLKLNGNPNLNHLVVKLLKVFDWQGHLVLVFELLSSNLYQLIKFTRYNGVSLDLVRKFAYQLLHALLQLELHKPHPIIHCDIKPENILLRNQNRSGIRLIDFGSACYANRRVHRYIQSRFYRSPEVILHLGYSTAIDRWSLGCVLVELHTGVPLFDGLSEAAQLARFEAILGPLPLDMLSASPCVAKFYTGSADSGFLLKEPALPRRSLESILGVTTGGPRGSRKGTAGHHEKTYREFLDFVSQLLRYRPEERLSCSDALRHPFVAPLYVKEKE